MLSQDCSEGYVAASKNLMSLSVIKKEQKISPLPDHLSRHENPHQSEIEKKEITKTFPLETLGMVTFPWVVPVYNRKQIYDSLARRFTYNRNGVERKRSPPTTAQVMLKYGVTHRLSTAYHPQTSGQVEDVPDCEDSRALSFVFHSQEFHILSFILGIQYPNLID
ncbi:reverse transcriptase domain-containing protein [Tanacetum coccineum]|uniref:Reverse transcriptase domain-containing protein n=1 Tax=Tanacetum coccineum TaxID=301880 RepID=A0ABQ4X9H1_9ASTR